MPSSLFPLFLLLASISSHAMGEHTTHIPLSLIGMSTRDHPNLRTIWWRQLIPSFIEEHLLSSNITISDRWEDGSQCRPRYFGLLNINQERHKEFLEGGVGFVQYEYDGKRMSSKCYYRTNVGTYVFPPSPKDPEGFFGVVMYCPIWKEAAFCEYLATKNVSLEVNLLPSGKELPDVGRNDSSGGEKSNEFEMADIMKTADIVVSGRFFSFKGILSQSFPSASIQHSSPLTAAQTEGGTPLSQLTVCTVQTYQSPLSGPMLWLFARYYHLLGFQVVIYDRYGRHESFLRNMIDVGEIKYHPYTAFQLARPELYTASRAVAEGSEYKMYYARENPKIKNGIKDKEGKFAYDTASDTLQQDRDKVLTLDSARLQYAQSRIFLALDCDEFLAPEGRSFTFKDFKNELHTKILNGAALKRHEELLLYRRSVPGVSDDPVMNLTDKKEHASWRGTATGVWLQ